MSTSAANESPSSALETLRSQIDLARSRLQDAAQRRRELEMSLQAAREAEDAARQALSALETVGREMFQLIPDGLSAAPPGEGLHPLAGGQLREMIARVGLRHRALGRAAHWSVWRRWLRAAGYDAAGKKPEATFLTQLARSPLVRRSPHDGVYILDVAQLARERRRLQELHRRLSELPPPDQLALLGDLRAQRRQLQNETARAERAVEEMWRVLAAERPPSWPEDVELVPERAVVAWLELHEATDPIPAV